MSLVLPVLYHWSPLVNRAGIMRRGLRPTCHTAGAMGPPRTWPVGEYREVDRDLTFLAVCLGTSPSHAWALSGAIQAERGEPWDLWEVALDDDDEVWPLPFFGTRLDEVRVAGTIPPARLWLVGSRTRGRRRWGVG